MWVGIHLSMADMELLDKFFERVCPHECVSIMGRGPGRLEGGRGGGGTEDAE